MEVVRCAPDLMPGSQYLHLQWHWRNIEILVVIMCLGEQSNGFVLDYAVAFTRPRFQFQSIKYRDVTASVANQTLTLQIPSCFRDGFAAHAEHAGNQLLCDSCLLYTSDAADE